LSRIHGFRKYFAEVPGSVGHRFRERRWKWFTQIFRDLEDMEIIDLGGTAQFWMRSSVRPAHVHLVNLGGLPSSQELPSWMSAEEADACDLPEHLLSRRFDLVFSNSVIEHVGGHYRRERFAENVHRLADRHWVQAPYRYFPLEPHWLFPGYAQLPLAARTAIARRWKLGMTPPKDKRATVNVVLKTELPTMTEMRYYFPNSKILVERAAGLPKSLIAVKTG